MDQSQTLNNYCLKLKAIIDRITIHRCTDKKSNFEEEFAFYSLVIPEIDKYIKTKDKNNKDTNKLIEVVNDWVRKNRSNCPSLPDIRKGCAKDRKFIEAKENAVYPPVVSPLLGSPVKRVSETGTFIIGGTKKRKTKKKKVKKSLKTSQ